MQLLLKNAHIVDGSGDEPFRGDILITREKISAIGSFAAHHAPRVLDCQGGVVMPGVIDVHSGSDHHANLLRFPDQEHYLLGGVTSAIGGHDGVSLAPFTGGAVHPEDSFIDPHPSNVDWRTMREFFRTLRRRPLGVNFGTLIGMETVRHVVKKDLNVMRACIAEDLEEGALGISFRYGTAGKQERAMIFEAALEYKVPVAIALQDDAKSAIKELAGMADDERPAIILQNLIRPLAHLETLLNLGIHVEAEPSNFTTVPIGALLPEWARSGGRKDALLRIKDEWMREKIAKELPDIRPEHFRVVHAPRQSPLVGITLADFMEHHSAKNAKEALLTLMAHSELRATVRAERADRDEARRILEYPNVVIGSRELGSYPMPWRGMELQGGFLALLEAVREEGVMPLQTFVKKVTAVPSDCFRLHGRGVIKEGAIADLVVLKDAKVLHAVVYGAIAVSGGEYAGTRHGRPLTRTKLFP